MLCYSCKCYSCEPDDMPCYPCDYNALTRIPSPNFQLRAALSVQNLNGRSGSKQYSPRKWSRRRSPLPDRRSRLPSPYQRTRHSPQKRARSRSPPRNDSKDLRLPKRNRFSSHHKANNDESSFRDGAATHGTGVCAICLGCHEHDFGKCRAAKLWDGAKNEARRNEQGRLVSLEGLTLCFDWQLHRGCQSTSHPENHHCSGCGKTDHRAQSCPRREK